MFFKDFSVQSKEAQTQQNTGILYTTTILPVSCFLLLIAKLKNRD